LRTVLFVWTGAAAGCCFVGYFTYIKTNKTMEHIGSRFRGSGKWDVCWMWKDWAVEWVGIQRQASCVAAADSVCLCLTWRLQAKMQKLRLT